MTATALSGILCVVTQHARADTGLDEAGIPVDMERGDEIAENGPPTEDDLQSTFVQWESVEAISATLAVRNLSQESQIRVDAELNFFGERCSWRAGEESVSALESTTFTVTIPRDCVVDEEHQKIFSGTVRVHVSTLNSDAVIDRASAPRILAWLNEDNDFQLALETEDHRVVDSLLLEELRSEGLVVEGRSFGF